MEDKIFDIVTDLISEDITKDEAIDKLLNLYNLSLSLLGVSKCPNSNCDNNGTIAYQTSKGYCEPAPCEWCHRKRELLNNEA